MCLPVVPLMCPRQSGGEFDKSLASQLSKCHVPICWAHQELAERGFLPLGQTLSRTFNGHSSGSRSRHHLLVCVVRAPPSETPNQFPPSCTAPKGLCVCFFVGRPSGKRFGIWPNCRCSGSKCALSRPSWRRTWILKLSKLQPCARSPLRGCLGSRWARERRTLTPTSNLFEAAVMVPLATIGPSLGWIWQCAIIVAGFGRRPVCGWWLAWV